MGMAALREDLGDDQHERGWAGSATDMVRAARLKQTLAIQQARAGALDEADQTIDGVVRIYRRLGRLAPGRYHPELAIALSARGLWASRLGRREQAAEALAGSV